MGALALFVSWISQTRKSEACLILLAVFRDATLRRETVEYMWDHHRCGYCHSMTNESLRPHAIAVLWSVNIMWLVAPPLTLVWAYQQLSDGDRRKDKKA